jgi:hypothetical protein
MKITETQLRQIVRQELLQVLNEDEQVNEGFGKALTGLGVAAMLALGYTGMSGGGMKGNEQDASQTIANIEKAEEEGDIAKLSPKEKLAIVRYVAASNATLAGNSPEKATEVANQKVNSYMSNGQISQRALDVEIQSILKSHPKVIKDFVQRFKQAKQKLKEVK